jgi:hypothetical protein
MESRLALGPTQRIQWAAGAFFSGVKWLGREADHSPPSNAGVNYVRIYTSTPHESSRRIFFYLYVI